MLTVQGDISASGTSESTGTISSIGSLYQAQLDNGTTAGPRFSLGSKADPDSFLSIQAAGGINKLDTKGRDFHLFSTAATTGFYFDEDNANIGIGTTNPTRALEIHGSTLITGSTDQNLQIENKSNDEKLILMGQKGFGAKMRYERNRGSYSFFTGMMSNTSRFAIADDSSNELISVFFDGQVGIGESSLSTSSPKLTVGGNMKVTSHITASGDISGSGLLIVSQSGIGLASPETVFHIQQPAGTTPELRVEALGNTNSKLMLKNSQGNWEIFREFTSKNLVFKNNAGDIPLILNKSHITASGDISSSGTITMLTASIGGGIFTSASLAAGGGGGAVSAVANGSNNRVATFSSTDALNGESGLTFSGAGNTLTIDAGVVANSGNNDQPFQVKGSSDDNLLQVNPQSDDKVGIGTATPTKKLTVAGDISSSGAINSLSHITASGNISSSGTATIQNLNVFGPASGQPLIYINDSDNGLGVSDGFLITKSGTNAFIYNRDSGHLEIGTNDKQQLHIEDSATTEGQLKIKDGGIDVTGHMTASGNISSSGTILGSTLQASGLTENRIPFIGAGGILEDSANFTVDGASSKFSFFTAATNRGFVVNEAGASDGDFRVEGDSDTHLIFADASADKLAIGTDTVGNSLLTIDGDVTTTNITASGGSKFGTTSGTTNTSHQFAGISGDTNFFLMLDADGEEVMKGEGSVGGGDLKYTFGDNAVAGNGTLFQVDEGNNKFILHNDSNNSKVGINTTAPTKELTVKGDISASGGFIGGATQNTGSYDFPGAIMGYNVDGHNSAHNSVSLTTSFAVPDDRLNVCFVAPKSGIVEIEVQFLLDMGTSAGTFVYVGLSDSSTYNSVANYYEQVIADPDENDDIEITHKWVVPSLTPGTTYKYWLGIKVLSTSGSPKIAWGGATSQRFLDFIMKATALPSNTDIQ